MNDALRHLDDLLRSLDGDAGCTAGESILDAYVDLELAGGDPGRAFPGTAIHLRSCPGCRADHDGLLEAAGAFGDLAPPE
ncbi:MAG TPA: hypothetical protein VGF68_03995 [Solirubrobacteraceae bacterium]|jgi:hypothetical protein